MSSRILVIDDETNIRTMIRLTLESSGYEVDVASDGPSGLVKYGDGGTWNLTLVDQRLPGMSGLEVQREIQRRNPCAPVILITAFATIDLALEAMLSGASEFLRKPFTADTLRMSVESALARPVEQRTAIPVADVCKEFTRTTFNGLSFELESDHVDENDGELTCVFGVFKGTERQGQVKVILPAYVQELVKAHGDTEQVPGGHQFWIAMCEEVLASFLWQNASLPPDGLIRIDDLSPSLLAWLDSVLTVNLSEEAHV